MTQPISIIIPCLNEEHFLPTLLYSLSNQKDTDFEVIVVDGNPEDRTVEVAQSFSSKLRSLKVVRSDKRGISYQRNFGSRLSSTQHPLLCMILACTPANSV